MAGKVFGVDLQTLVNQEKAEVPRIVTHLLDYLTSSEAYLEEGLFRIPGNTVRISELKKIIDKDGRIDLAKQKDVDAHTAGALLKLYLRELPIPLIIPRYYSTFLKVYANPDQRQRTINTRKLVTGLPKCNKDLLIAVMRFLHLVTEHEPVNKMSALNLAVIFAPNMLRGINENLNQIMEDSNKVAGTVQLMIQEVEYIDKGVEPQWFMAEGGEMNRSKSGSLLPSPRLDVSQSTPPSSGSAISSPNTSLATSVDLSSIQDDELTDPNKDIDSSALMSAISLISPCDSSADESANSEGGSVKNSPCLPRASESPKLPRASENSPRLPKASESPKLPRASENSPRLPKASENSPRTPRAPSSFQTPSSPRLCEIPPCSPPKDSDTQNEVTTSPPISPPPAATATAAADSNHETSTTPRADQVTQSQNSPTASSPLSSTPPSASELETSSGTASLLKDNSHELTPNATIQKPLKESTSDPQLNISQESPPSPLLLRASQASHSESLVAPRAPPPPPKPKTKSRLRKATIGLFSPLVKVSHKGSYTQPSTPVAASDRAEVAWPQSNSPPSTREKIDSSDSATDNIDTTIRIEVQGETGQTQPHGSEPKPQSSPNIRRSERSDKLMSDSPEMNRKANTEVATRERRHSESDTAPPTIVAEKVQEEKSRNRSSTLLSKIGAMSFRKSAGRGTPEPAFLNIPASVDDRAKDRGDKNEKSEKSEKSEKPTKSGSKLDIRQRVDVRIEDS